MLKNNDFIKGNLFQFSPYILFLAIYISLYYYTLHAINTYHSSTTIIAGLPVFVAFIATIYAFFTFKESLTINKKTEIFLSGVAHHTAINYYFIIIFMAVFNHMIAKTNGVLTAVTLGLLYIPTLWIMSSIFLLTSIISIIINSLPVTIVICMPIACGIAQSLQINSPFMAATIISGALCGNHILLFFKNIRIYEQLTLKNFTNLYHKMILFIIPAAISTLIILSQYKCQSIEITVIESLKSSLTIQNYITLIPYCFLLFASLFNINIFPKLVIASCIALVCQIVYHQTLFLDAIVTIFKGFYEESTVVNLVLLYLIIAGLTKIIEYNSGFDYLIENLKFKKNQNSLKFLSSITFIAIITNLFVIIDELSLNLITRPIEEFATKYNISQNKITNLLHLTTTTVQTILPYSAIMFLSIHLSQNSYIEILCYMIYPIIITILTIISILIS